MSEEILRLDRRTCELLVERAWSDFPYEVCGLLGLRSDGGIVHFPMTNAERSMTYYVMDGKELLRAMRTIEEEGWGLAIYHSHTHTEAFPSRTDVELSAYPEAFYLIVSLQDRDTPELRAFRIIEGRISEVPLVVDDVAP
ncbi:MAG: M67 family metallopeptidase [Actinomycetota bacterium]|nr:M67 family metallopeptidase [Actinomycetota bacterium]